METKNFAIKTETSVKDGQIKVVAIARVKTPNFSMTQVSAGCSGSVSGVELNIFLPGVDVINIIAGWSTGYVKGSAATNHITKMFATGASAAKYIAKLERLLDRMEERQACLEQEVAEL